MIDEMEFHEQAEVLIGRDQVFVDALMAKVIGWCNSRGYKTYGSCQSYGEYLRSLGMDFNHESTRDYGYIEFYELDEAVMFLNDIKDRVGITGPLWAKIVQEGTPGAWELKLRLSTGRFWVWFPTEDIPLIEQATGR